MAFTVEDGTGVAGANAYIDVPFFTEYFTERGVTFTETDDVIKTWIIQATDYIEQVFGWRLVGVKKTETQGLHFPATEAYSRDGTLLADDAVPVALKRACTSYANRVKSGPLMPDPLVSDEGYNVVTSRKKIGPIEKEFRVMGSSGQPILIRSYPAADSLITPLLSYASAGTRVIR